MGVKNSDIFAYVLDGSPLCTLLVTHVLSLQIGMKYRLSSVYRESLKGGRAPG